MCSFEFVGRVYGFVGAVSDRGHDPLVEFSLDVCQTVENDHRLTFTLVRTGSDMHETRRNPLVVYDTSHFSFLSLKVGKLTNDNHLYQSNIQDLPLVWWNSITKSFSFPKKRFLSSKTISILAFLLKI